MNKENVDLIRKTIKELENKKIWLSDLNIVNEIDCQMEEELSNEDYCKLFCEIENAYFKLENVDLSAIVRCALDNKRRILNDDDNFNLRDEACWY